MADKRLKRLADLRLVLSAIAVLLAVSMVVSGVKHFWIGSPSVPEEQESPDATISQQETFLPTKSSEPESIPIMPDTNDAEEGADHHGELKPGRNVPGENPNEGNHNPGSDGSSGSEPVITNDGGGDSVGSESGTPNESGGSSGSEPAITNDGGSDSVGSESGTPNESGGSVGSESGTPNESGGSVGSESGIPNESGGSVGSGSGTPNDGGSNPGGRGSEKQNEGAPSLDNENTKDSDSNEITNTSQSVADKATVDIQPIGGSRDEETTQGADDTEPTIPPAVIEDPDDFLETEQTAVPQVTDEITEPAVTTAAEPETKKTGPDPWGILFWTSAALLAVDLAAILVLSRRIDAERKNREVRRRKKTTVIAPRKLQQPPAVGTIHQVGRRDYQQDSLGHSAVLGGKGMLAVLADGMGGLSGGDKISQQIVMKMLTLGQQLKSGQTGGVLRKMLAQVNEDVNRTLGAEGLYKSGSTMVAVLVQGREFQWISVGDSRIYLYRQGYANQLNRDHDQLQVWMSEVLEGKRSCEETLRNPDGRKLTSFIGMGQLKQVDASLSAIELEPDDRLVLMSDGVYNVISEEHLAAILKQYPNVNQAAAAMERVVREAQNPHQDNYTAIILGF